MNKTVLKNNHSGKDNRGGARPGAGRPKGSGHRITVTSILEALQAKTGGYNYEQLLIDDFLAARNGDDRNLLVKYHQLLLNKIVADKAEIEITNNADLIELKKQAFKDALDNMIKKETS